MITAIKVTSLNAQETEDLFKGKVKFLVNEKGEPEELMFFNDSGHAAIKVQVGNYSSLKVDHVAFKNSQIDHGKFSTPEVLEDLEWALDWADDSGQTDVVKKSKAIREKYFGTVK